MRDRENLCLEVCEQEKTDWPAQLQTLTRIANLWVVNNKDTDQTEYLHQM